MRTSSSVPAPEVPAASTSPEGGSSNGHRPSPDDLHVRYDSIRYLKYENPNWADRAKKRLEHAAVQTILTGFSASSGDRSLDIGCATCRYPLWFAKQGFAAVGYDIDDEAIRISQAAAQAYPNIEIHKRNVLERPPEPGAYAVITSMMGTFNHIARSDQEALLRWSYESLRPGGMVIFSSWNPVCVYTSYLHFYEQGERAILRANSRTAKGLAGLLEGLGFGAITLTPTCFLPDACYESWVPRLSTMGLQALEATLLAHLPPDQAQLFVVCAVKP